MVARGRSRMMSAVARLVSIVQFAMSPAVKRTGSPAVTTDIGIVGGVRATVVAVVVVVDVGSVDVEIVAAGGVGIVIVACAVDVPGGGTGVPPPPPPPPLGASVVEDTADVTAAEAAPSVDAGGADDAPETAITSRGCRSVSRLASSTPPSEALRANAYDPAPATELETSIVVHPGRATATRASVVPGAGADDHVTRPSRQLVASRRTTIVARLPRVTKTWSAAAVTSPPRPAMPNRRSARDPSPASNDVRKPK